MRFLEYLIEESKRWKQTSLTPVAAIKKYGKANVRVKKGRAVNGSDIVEILSAV